MDKDCILIDYTNWRGERRNRVVRPTGRMMFGSNQWHPDEQWLFEAIDLEEAEPKWFALSGLRGVCPATVSS